MTERLEGLGCGEGSRARRAPNRRKALFRVKLTNFRCFADTSDLELLPITFLVGENSTGKTSFLAAVRQLIDSFSRTTQNPFNRDPYFLGGFEQIARYPGGKGGRAKSFSLELVVPSTAETHSSKFKRPESRHKFTFTKGSPQPELCEYVFSSRGIFITLTLDEKAKIKIVNLERDTEFDLDVTRLPPASLLRRDTSFLRYVLDEIMFGQQQELNSDPEWRRISDAMRPVFDHSVRAISRRTYASSPVRTQPLRTYTPSEITPSSEGTHVPLEMARQKKSSPTAWDGLHGKLASFGKASGLFEDIDIRLFGKAEGDPFQVMVKTKGPPVNIVDVGYGVSQVLPIIYQLELSAPREVYLLQQPEVHLHPRAQAEVGSLVASVSARMPSALYVLETHSDYIIDRVRVEIAAKKLDHRRVTIIFFERTPHGVEARNIYFSERGEIINPPESFRSFFLEEHARLLGV